MVNQCCSSAVTRTDGKLVVKQTYASPSLNAPDHLFALHVSYTPSFQWGTVVVAADGTPIGLAGNTRVNLMASRSFSAGLILSTCQRCCWIP